MSVAQLGDCSCTFEDLQMGKTIWCLFSCACLFRVDTGADMYEQHIDLEQT